MVRNKSFRHLIRSLPAHAKRRNWSTGNTWKDPMQSGGTRPGSDFRALFCLILGFAEATLRTQGGHTERQARSDPAGPAEEQWREATP